MSQTVFILGAGASRSAGAPLMADFLDVAEQLRNGSDIGNASDSFDLVFEGLAALQQAHSKASINLDNIESVFAAFEMAKLVGRLGDLCIERIQHLPFAMRQVIEKTIEATVRFPIDGLKILPSAPYPELARLVLEVISGSGSSKHSDQFLQRLREFSVITFNYDICADYAFFSQGVPIRYCLSATESTNSLAVLKLHGSLNWGRCTACKKLVPWPLERFLQNRRWAQKEVASIILPVASLMHEFQHCPSKPVEGPYLVPPTWNKSQYHESLESVWQAAAAELSTAENIFVSGYSLPETDEFFRYLYALGTIGNTRIKRFWVFDPDARVAERFRKLLGSGALSRFKFFEKPFVEMFYEVRQVFGLMAN